MSVRGLCCAWIFSCIIIARILAADPDQTVETELAQLVATASRKAVEDALRQARPKTEEAAKRFLVERYREAAMQSLAFFETHPTHPLRWDGLVLAQRAVCKYLELVLALRAQGREERVQSLREIYHTDEFWQSLTRRRIGANVDLALATPNVDPHVYASLAEEKMDFIRTYDFPESYLSLLQPEAIGDLKKQRMRELAELKQGIEQRFPDGPPSTESIPANRSYLSTASGAYHHVSYGYWSMLSHEASPEEYASAMKVELEQGKFPAVKKLLEDKYLKRAEMNKAIKPISLKFTSIDGQEIDTERMRGKVVLVDFWATWCGPCIEEIPNLREVYSKYHSRGFEIIGISVDQERDRQKFIELCQKQGVVWPQQFTGTGNKNEFYQKFGLGGLPTMFLLDQHGRLVSARVRGRALEREVRKLLNLSALGDPVMFDEPFGS